MIAYRVEWNYASPSGYGRGHSDITWPQELIAADVADVEALIEDSLERDGRVKIVVTRWEAS